MFSPGVCSLCDTQRVLWARLQWLHISPVSIRASLFSLYHHWWTLSGSPAHRPALSSSQFNKTAPFMLVVFSSGNGFSQWVCVFLSPGFTLFPPVLLGPTPGQILCHWLWFPKVSDPLLRTWPVLPEIWPHFGSPRLILYTLMQSEAARLNSLSVAHPPHPFSYSPSPFLSSLFLSLSSPPLVSKLPSWDSFPVCRGM